MININVSIGELVDKVSILSIKLKKIKDQEKLKNILQEYELLEKSMESIGISEKSKEFKDLERVNLKLWDIEDKIRAKEARKEFDSDFINLARSVYLNNDHRAELKKEINIKRGSMLLEEKEYVNY
jgi:hypothetical protein